MKSWEKTVYHALRIIISVIFIYAGIDKIFHPQGFAEAIFSHQILPDELINLTAVVLPWTELLLGLCLLFNIWAVGASVLAAGLMSLFISIITFNLIRGLDVGCGCFSTSATDTMNILTWLRDISILVLTVGLVWLAARHFNQRTITTVD